MKHLFTVLLMGAALCGGMNRVALAQVAQTEPQLALPTLTPVEQAKKIHSIQVKNVPPSLLAYWLDPKNTYLPSQFRAKNSYPRQAAENTGSTFVLPPGIDRIAAIDPQKTLLVFGTEAGFRKLAEIVAFLDKPLRQVEIEAQWVQVSREDARAFGIDYNGATGNFNSDSAPRNNEARISFVRGNFQTTLSRLVKENRAKVLTAPRILAINNLRAEVGSFSASPAVVNFKDKRDASNLSAFFAGTSQIGVEYGLSVTPTINNDDTVTVLLSTSSKLKIQTANGDELVSPGARESLESIVNARDGDTFALSGFSISRQSPAPAANAKNLVSDTLIFITARIVRRAEDDVKAVALKR